MPSAKVQGEGGKYEVGIESGDMRQVSSKKRMKQRVERESGSNSSQMLSLCKELNLNSGMEKKCSSMGEELLAASF